MGSSDLVPATVVAIAGAGGVLGALIPLIARRGFKRDEEQERARLRNELLGAKASPDPTVINVGEGSRVYLGESAKVDADEHGLTDAGEAQEDLQVATAPRSVERDAHTARFALLLVEYYAYGLTQARRSFAVSITCSVLGGLVLIAGVLLAIIRADTNGEVYAGVVTSLAGVLTTSIGALFHQQANRSLKHMEEQTNKLRQDMKAERDADTAIDLLDNVTDQALLAHLQAALILRFSGATLPNISYIESQQEPAADLNGNRRIRAPGGLPEGKTNQ